MLQSCRALFSDVNDDKQKRARKVHREEKILKFPSALKVIIEVTRAFVCFRCHTRVTTREIIEADK